MLILWCETDQLQNCSMIDTLIGSINDSSIVLFEDQTWTDESDELKKSEVHAVNALSWKSDHVFVPQLWSLTEMMFVLFLTESQTKPKVQRYFLLILEFCPVQLCLVWARSWTSVVTCWSNTWSLDGRCWFLISNLSVRSDKRSFLTWSNWLFWFF